MTSDSMLGFRRGRTFQTLGAFCNAMSVHAYPLCDRDRYPYLMSLFCSVHSLDGDRTLDELIETRLASSIIKLALIDGMDFKSEDVASALLSKALKMCGDTDYQTADLIDEIECLDDGMNLID